MPYFKTSQEWLDHSIALLEARPSQTRVTVRYSIKPVKPRKPSPTTDNETTTDDAAPSTTTTRPPRGSLVLKTYDPVGGVTLKYRTTKAAEVTRLMGAAMGRLGRAMAGVQDVPEEEMRDVDAAAGAAAAEGDAGALQKEQGQQQQQQGGGGGKKKKKGKK
ncbi:signal recognition particle 9 kDa domain-containing protein [Trichoderma aethiopicum]